MLHLRANAAEQYVQDHAPVRGVLQCGHVQIEWAEAVVHLSVVRAVMKR